MTAPRHPATWDQLVDLDQIADLARVSRRQVLRWVRAGQLPGVIEQGRGARSRAWIGAARHVLDTGCTGCKDCRAPRRRSR